MTLVKCRRVPGPYRLPMIDSAALAAIRHNPLLSGLGDAEQSVLVSLGTTTGFPTGTVLYERGDAAWHLFVVVEGTIAAPTSPTKPAPRSHSIRYRRGTVPASSCWCSDSHYYMSARVITDALVFSIESRRLSRFLDQRFDLVLGMLVGMSTRLRGLIREITALKMASTAERLGISRWNWPKPAYRPAQASSEARPDRRHAAVRQADAGPETRHAAGKPVARLRQTSPVRRSGFRPDPGRDRRPCRTARRSASRNRRRPDP